MNALISVLHVLLAIRPALYRYVDPGQAAALSEMAVRDSTATTVASVVIALTFAI